MPSVYNVRAVWAGFAGSPGYSNFRFAALGTDTANNAAGAAVHAYFQALAIYLEATWTVTIQSEVTEWDVVTGKLLGATNMTQVPVPANGGAVTANYAGGSGYVVSWRTSQIFNGRRVQGRTFMVPSMNCFDTDGTLLNSAITVATNAGNALIAAVGADFGIWAKQYSKPVPPAAPVQVNGIFAPATGCFVKDMASQLRSRRT